MEYLWLQSYEVFKKKMGISYFLHPEKRSLHTIRPIWVCIQFAFNQILWSVSYLGGPQRSNRSMHPIGTLLSNKFSVISHPALKNYRKLKCRISSREFDCEFHISPHPKVVFSFFEFSEIEIVFAILWFLIFSFDVYLRKTNFDNRRNAFWIVIKVCYY